MVNDSLKKKIKTVLKSGYFGSSDDLVDVSQNYSAKIEYDSVDRIFVGHIIGIRDIVSFHGNTVEELESGFREAVDHYLEVCEKIGQTPQKSYSSHSSQYINVLRVD